MGQGLRRGWWRCGRLAARVAAPAAQECRTKNRQRRTKNRERRTKNQERSPAHARSPRPSWGRGGRARVQLDHRKRSTRSRPPSQRTLTPTVAALRRRSDRPASRRRHRRGLSGADAPEVARTLRPQVDAEFHSYLARRRARRNALQLTRRTPTRTSHRRCAGFLTRIKRPSRAASSRLQGSPPRLQRTGARWARPRRTDAG